jgi:DUF2075 family protein
MLAYLATKDQFLEDAPSIEDIVKAEVKKKLNFTVPQNEYLAWRNSLGNAMFHVMNSKTIPGDAGVAIEYRLNGRRFRIDFMISGQGAAGKESLVIIELKQWTDIQYSDLAEHVRTFVGGAIRDERHPSYQAWSYASHMKLYNEYVYGNDLDVQACAYLHNCKDSSVIGNSRYENELRKAPVFLNGELEGLRSLITGQIVRGSGTALLERIDAAIIRPSQQLADAIGSMLDGQEEFVLLDEQKTVLEKIIRSSKESQTGKKQVLIINGGPGTGKSVISINALSRLTGKRLNARYVTPNAAPRAVYESKLKKIVTGDAFKHLFSGSGAFTEVEHDTFDTLIVDESHRLKMKSGMFRNMGENQAKEIIRSARTSVFFIDEAQKVTWADVGEIAMIEDHARALGAEVEHLELYSQFRCGGSDDYMAWLDNTLGGHPMAEHYFSPKRFDFKIIDSPVELHKLIKEKNKINNKSRVVAGYCWNWISKNRPQLFDIEIQEFGFKARWNLSSHGSEWIINPNSVEEIGCIHTCQGLEVDYVGVIIGPDLRVVDGRLVTDPSARAKTDKSLSGYVKESQIDPVGANLKADEIIRNTYRTLMSRGMKGCYVYFTDPRTAKYFRNQLPE